MESARVTSGARPLPGRSPTRHRAPQGTRREGEGRSKPIFRRRARRARNRTSCIHCPARTQQRAPENAPPGGGPDQQSLKEARRRTTRRRHPSHMRGTRRSCAEHITHRFAAVGHARVRSRGISPRAAGWIASRSKRPPAPSLEELVEGAQINRRPRSSFPFGDPRGPRDPGDRVQLTPPVDAW